MPVAIATVKEVGNIKTEERAAKIGVGIDMSAGINYDLSCNTLTASEFYAYSRLDFNRGISLHYIALQAPPHDAHH